MSKVSIAVVIPSGDSRRDTSLALLIKDAQQQTSGVDEIEVVRGVSPNGRARNQGVENTRSDLLIFLDDDIRLGSNDVFEKFARALEIPGVGMVGTSQLLPPDSSNFQKRCARQIPRSQSAIVESLTNSDMVTTQCCALRRDVLESIGGFNGEILRGVDPELRHRVRQAGLRVAVVANAWHYHPMPETWRALIEMAYRNGYASAFAQRHFPETVLFNPEGHVDKFEARPPLLQRLLRRAKELASRIATGQDCGIVYDLAYAAGFLQSRWKSKR
ncbi:unnamed protein product [Phaeothamnion confervicola]